MSNSPAKNRSAGRSRGGYPLSLLFLLTAFCAVLAATVSLAMQSGNVSVQVTASLLGGSGGFCLGTFIAMWHVRPLLGSLIGAPLGGILGAMAGATWHVDSRTFPQLFLLQACGAIMLVVLATWGSHGNIAAERFDDLMVGEPSMAPDAATGEAN